MCTAYLFQKILFNPKLGGNPNIAQEGGLIAYPCLENYQSLTKLNNAKQYYVPDFKDSLKSVEKEVIDNNELSSQYSLEKRTVCKNSNIQNKP